MTARTEHRRGRRDPHPAPQGETRRGPFAACLEAALARYLRDLNGHKPAGLYDLVIREVEKPLLEMVLDYTGGNQSQAAELLGMNRNTLRKKLRNHGITP